MTLGMMRTVVPALAESEFGVPRGSVLILVAFVVAFGFVKGAMNFVAGRLAEGIGRRPVWLIGWLTALPIPLLLYFAASWNSMAPDPVRQPSGQPLGATPGEAIDASRPVSA